MPLTLELVGGDFCICRLPPDALIPDWADSKVFCSITRTAEELSILCPTNQVSGHDTSKVKPDSTAIDFKSESEWRLLKLRGPFEFTEMGILVQVLVPLAQARVAILAISSFDTDFVLVKHEKLDMAVETLRKAGLVVVID